MRKFIPILIVLLFIPLTIYAQNDTKIENLIIKTEIQESPETRELLKQLTENQKEQGERFNQLLIELKEKQIVVNSDSETWTSSDLLSVSSTIVGFFGFGSFIIIRFQSRNRSTLAKYMKFIFYIVGIVILTHLFMIFTIVNSDSVNKEMYLAGMVLTMIAVAVIMTVMADIIMEENKGKIAQDRIKNAPEEVRNLIDARIEEKTGIIDGKNL